jgi:hypothetical protein
MAPRRVAGRDMEKERERIAIRRQSSIPLNRDDDCCRPMPIRPQAIRCCSIRRAQFPTR